MSDKLIEAGLLIEGMSQILQKHVEEAVNKNKHRREPYYILVTASWFKNGEELRMQVCPRDTRPPKMLNTMCWRMNNITGELKQLWVLPPDAPIQPIDTAPIIESIAEDAKDMPIIY